MRVEKSDARLELTLRQDFVELRDGSRRSFRRTTFATHGVQFSSSRLNGGWMKEESEQDEPRHLWGALYG